MRLGTYIKGVTDAESYVAALKSKGYRAAYCPEYIKSAAQIHEIQQLREACRREDIVIAEVGAWVNPLSPNAEEARAARNYIVDRFRLADALGARCCVNIVGSASAECWYGYHPDNFSRAFFDRAVSVYQSIVDEVAPRETTMAFEIMPYSIPCDTDSYLRFLEAMDRPGLSVHLDPANMLNCPKLLCEQQRVYRDAVARLGAKISSVHVKDLALDRIPFNTHLDEVRPGLGEMDLPCLLECLSALDEDLPIMMEHLTESEYDAGAAYLRSVAEKLDLRI